MPVWDENRGRQNCDGSRAHNADRLLIRPASGRQAGTGLSDRTNHWKDTRQRSHSEIEPRTKSTDTNLTNAPDGTTAHSQFGNVPRRGVIGRALVGKLRDMANEIPQTLDNARVLKYAHVTAAVDPTGKTRHLRGGTQLGPASALAVAKYDGHQGYYLFYLDDEARVLTDTWHESVDRALAQAAFEYVGLTWSDVSG